MNDHQTVLMNLEINMGKKGCQLTEVCGDLCILNLHENALGEREVLSPEHTLLAADEIIARGDVVRHLAIVGKEPLQSPELLFAILKRFHAAPAETRPASVGIITSALLLRGMIPQFVEAPLDWCAVSLDVESGLHVQRHNDRLLRDVLELRERGGVKAVLINTVYDGKNDDAVISLGKKVCAAGVNQWAVAPLLVPRKGVFKGTISLRVLKQFKRRIVDEFRPYPVAILFELEHRHYVAMTRHLKKAAESWRLTHRVRSSPNVYLLTGSLEPGRLIRVRWDGHILNKQDFNTIGKEEGVYGRYTPGRLTEVLSQIRSDQEKGAIHGSNV